MSESARNSIRVLYVGDEPGLADTAARSLEREDESIDVVTETSASDALDRLVDGDVDCIVSDYDMPEMDGLEFLRRVRGAHPDLPFVLFPARGSEEVASDAIAAGVTDYFPRGTGTDQYAVLAGRVRNAVEDARSRRDRIEFERELEAERAFVDQALDTLEDVFYVVGTNGELRRWNERLLAVTGYTDRAVDGMRAVELFPEDERGAVSSAIEEAMSSGRATVEADLLTADGERVPYEITGTRLTDPNDELDGLVGIGRDVTERKERERELRRTAARLEALFDHSPDMINVHDTEGTLIDPNVALCERTGYDEAELAEMKVWDLDRAIGPDEAHALWETMETGDKRKVEGVYRRRDGSEFPVEVHVRRLDLEGEDRFVAISRDITDRRERERELERQNERLEEFASVVSHDLRNPLNVAQGRLELMRAECDSDHFDVIERAHDRMETLIDDVLALSRGDDRIDDPESVSLADVVADSWQHVRTGDATLVVEANGRIRADRGRLTRLLENLLRNAVEHGGEAVTVTVGDLAGGFYLEDDGRGIPEDERERVLEAGYSTDQGGTGFGLNIVEQTADAHDWELALTESEDGGVRFEFTGVERAP